MPHSKKENPNKLSQVESVTITTAVALATGIGAGVGAAIQGDSVVKSAAIVGAGTGLLTYVGSRFFSKKSETGVTFPQAVCGLAIYELVGTSIGYGGAKLFLGVSTSLMPFVDATIGFPVTVGCFYCLGLMVQYANNNQSAPAPRPHRS